jgi:hypothetical protein
MTILLTIDRFEGGEAVLKTKDNQTIIWPKNKLPADAREGALLVFHITSDQDQTEDRRQLAREILNEILNVEE